MDAFNTHSYDCVLTATYLTAEKLPYMSFMQSMQPYGFQVVTNKAVVVVRPLVQKLWTWTLVFDRDVWLVMAGGLVFVGIAMWWLEGEWNEENFGEEDAEAKEGEEKFTTKGLTKGEKMLRGLGHGLYFSFAGFASKTEEFAPKTAAGRVLGIFQAFSVYLIVCFFTAQLAAILIAGEPSVQPITSISSFASLNAAACILDKSEYTSFMAENYPGIKTLLIPGSIYSLLDAIADGTCLGAVAPDAVLKYTLGPVGDVPGAYCGLETVGSLLNAAFYAIPFNPKISSSVISGLNTLALQLLANGSYTAQAAINFPDADGRTQCEPPPVVPTLTGGLALEDMSGIFFVQAMGVAAAFLLVAILKLISLSGLRPGRAIEDLHHWPARPVARSAAEPSSAAEQIRSLLEEQDKQAANLRRRTQALLEAVQEQPGGGAGATRGFSLELNAGVAGKEVELASHVV